MKDAVLKMEPCVISAMWHARIGKSKSLRQWTRWSQYGCQGSHGGKQGQAGNDSMQCCNEDACVCIQHNPLSVEQQVWPQHRPRPSAAVVGMSAGMTVSLRRGWQRPCAVRTVSVWALCTWRWTGFPRVQFPCWLNGSHSLSHSKDRDRRIESLRLSWTT